MLGVKAGGCVMVGDSVVDVRAGKYAGMRTVGVLSGIYSCVELGTENPDLILESVCLLPDFLDLLIK
jgi:phosphoglycolate phosphatase